jgi:hypothetical protein
MATAMAATATQMTAMLLVKAAARDPAMAMALAAAVPAVAAAVTEAQQALRPRE